MGKETLDIKLGAELIKALLKNPTAQSYELIILTEGPLAALKYYKNFKHLKERKVLTLLIGSVRKISSRDVPSALNYVKKDVPKRYKADMVYILISRRSKSSINYEALSRFDPKLSTKLPAVKKVKMKILRQLATGTRSPFMLSMDSSFTDTGSLSMLYFNRGNMPSSELMITPKEFADALKKRYMKFPKDKTVNKPTIYIRTDGAYGTKFINMLKKEMGKLPMPDIFTFYKA